MATYKKLESTYINGEQVFNFGGLVPGILVAQPPSQPIYYLVNTYDCDCNGQLTNQIYKDAYDVVSGLTPNVDYFADSGNSGIKFFLLGTTTNTSFAYELIEGADFSSNSDCSVVNCY